MKHLIKIMMLHPRRSGQLPFLGLMPATIPVLTRWLTRLMGLVIVVRID